MEINEKKCILCNKPYNYKYKILGRGCLDKLYEQLDIVKPPRIIRNKEMYFCTIIAWKNHKFFLTKNKKYEVTKRYIALDYLNKFNYPVFDDVKKQIKEDINKISVFSKNVMWNVSFSLNEIYKAYKDSKKFDELINEFKNFDIKNVDKSMAKTYIKSMSFIFDSTKKVNPILYALYYSMQYKFWQIVVAGGVLADMKLSAMLLLNSLSEFEKEPKNLIISDEEIIKNITDSVAFKKKISFLIRKYGNNKDEFVLDDTKNKDILIRFEEDDLLFALHDATMFVKAKKSEKGVWNLEIKINDTYDFTDFKKLEDYVDSKNNKIIDIFSTTLNNLGVISNDFGVIKSYDLVIPFKYTVDNNLDN